MKGSKGIFPDLGQRYDIIGQIGRGGMADVFRVRNRETGEIVACKVMHEQLSDERASRRFAAEFRLTSRLKHPNIITVYDYGLTSDGRPFYTMALVKGTTLEQASRKMSIQAIFSAVFDVCLALDRIHQAGLIHNDVKDRNVMLTGSGRALLMDFGLVNTGQTQTKHFKGTIGYAAPELLRGEPYSHRADLYSLGVMIYHCLARHLPFPGDTIAAIIHAQLSGRYIPLSDARPDIDPQISRIVSRLMAVDPLRRFPSAADVLGALEAVPETGLASRSAELAPVYGLPEDFAGRRAILNRLKAFSMREEPGGASVLLITGPEGIGKSRLARELKIQLQTEGYRFIGVIVRGGGEGPLAAIRSALHAALTEAGTEEEERIAEQAPYLGILFPDRFHASPPDSYRSLEPSRRRAVFLRQLATAFARLVSDKPTLLFLDDLHHGNASLLRWLSEIPGALPPNAPLRVLAAADEPQWSDGEVNRKDITLPVDTLALEPFSEEETRAFLEKRFGNIRFSDFLVRRFSEESGGNPRFLEEIIRELVERSLIERKRFRWMFDPKKLESLPAARGIRDILHRRIGQLPEHLRSLLDRLSVFPDPVMPETFQQVAEQPLEDLLTGLRTLTMRGFLSEDRRHDQWSYRFRQNQVRTILYDNLPPAQRRRWHLLAAEALENTSLSPDQGALAHHYHRGGDLPKAMRCFFRAGKHAVSLFAFEDAVSHITRMLDVLAILGHPRRGGRPVWTNAAYNLLAESYMECGRPGDAEKTLRKHLAFADRQGDTLDRVFILQNLGALNFNVGRLDKAARYYHKARVLLDTHPPDAQTGKIRVQLEYNTGIIALSRGALDLAEHALRNTIRTARTTGDRYLKAAGYANLAVCLSLKNQPVKELRRWSLRTARKHRFTDITITNRMEQAMEQTHLGAVAKACGIIEETIGTADTTGAVRWRILTRLWSIRSLLLAGRFNDARRFVHEAESLASDADTHHHGLRIQHAKGLILVFDGRREEGIRFLEESVALAAQMKNRIFGLLAGADLMEALAEIGKPETVRKRLKSMEKNCKKLQIKRLYDDFSYINALLAWRSGDMTTLSHILHKWLPEPYPNPTLPHLKGFALLAETSFEPDTPSSRLTKIWKPLITCCNRRGIHYLEFQFLSLWLQQRLAIKAGLTPRQIEMSRALSERLHRLARKTASPYLIRLADTIALQLGRRVGDPDTSYHAHRRLAEMPADNLETQQTQTDIWLHTTAGTTGTYVGGPTGDTLNDSIRSILDKDTGGRLLLKLLDELDTL